jgi:hypothetical protein
MGEESEEDGDCWCGWGSKEAWHGADRRMVRPSLLRRFGSTAVSFICSAAELVPSLASLERNFKRPRPAHHLAARKAGTRSANVMQRYGRLTPTLGAHQLAPVRKHEATYSSPRAPRRRALHPLHSWSNGYPGARYSSHRAPSPTATAVASVRQVRLSRPFAIRDAIWPSPFIQPRPQFGEGVREKG